VRVTFADCIFDLDTHEVFRKGQLVALSPKAFELLELLVRERPKALSKEKIHEHLWPEVFVSDASLSNLIAELRAALGDEAQKPRILRTVRRFGYAFQAQARETSAAKGSPPRSAFRLVWELREIELRPGENFFGRDQDAAVWIDDASVSRRHARILVENGSATLEDLGSKNGTFVNGEPVRGPTRLSDGDEVEVGRAAMTFRVLQQTGSTQTASGLKRRAKPARRSG
jgi:DNA-binding winged helix-turn-helix (wHTH) protein